MTYIIVLDPDSSDPTWAVLKDAKIFKIPERALNGVTIKDFLHESTLRGSFRRTTEDQLHLDVFDTTVRIGGVGVWQK